MAIKQLGLKTLTVKLLLIVGVMLLGSGLGIAQSVNGKKIPVSAKLSIVGGKGKRTLGETFQAHDVTVVQFWASWCVGCGEVMSSLAKMSKRDATVGFVSVSIDEDMPTAVRYFKSKPDEVKAALPKALLDMGGEKIAQPLSIKSLPVVLLAGKDGTVYETIAGHPKPGQLESMIAKIRSSKPHK